MGACYSAVTKAEISEQILGSFASQGDDGGEFVSTPDVKAVPTLEYNASYIYVTSSFELPNHFRRLILISDLDSQRLLLTRNLPVDLMLCEGNVTASFNDIDEFGIGSNENEAIEDLKASIVDLFYLYKSEQENLGPLPQRQWNFLKSVISES
ncbi:MAG: hypothetical protein BMS9Abin36_1124 [Gammaproteobacteria bacterium]|nr:MAG: hypothetical protein BMS9Abin36_1124 [Gammaproteobacteria bacterium]